VNLTSQLLTFSKGGKPVRKVIDLRPVIENAVKFALSGSRVSYDLFLNDELSMVEADEGQIGQVVQNIVLNAEQSMPLGGRIEIAARNVPPARAAVHSLSAPDGLVEIVVRDQGMGIPPEHLPRIFDPYFTTKEKGSGLGLATSYSIVKNHEGTIEVASELGKGSTFTVYLPASRSVAQPDVWPVAAGRAGGRRGRILVMDDEALVRVVAAELLRELGQVAEFAEDGDAAIEKYKQAKEEGRPFDVVILDLTIRGGKGGAETVQELLAIDPGVKAVVSSGYSDDEIIATYRQHGFSSFLKKPYDMQALARMLDDVMA
jgi:CheY-like chemotaxis protein